MNQSTVATKLADLAVQSLIEEVRLTPKPGLVDQHDQGAHTDLTLQLMLDSANCLHETFYEMALMSYGENPTIELREKFGAIGRAGEQKMLGVTNV